jgi:hypothetical protein
MAVFCVARKEFVNQLMGAIDLGALVEMLRRWYSVRAGAGRAADHENHPPPSGAARRAESRGFARRLWFPLLSGIALAVVVVMGWHRPDVVIIAGLAAVWKLYWAGSIVWKKLRYVRAYYRAMRRGLVALYSSGPQQ